MLTAVNILLKSFVCLEENLQGEICQTEKLKNKTHLELKRYYISTKVITKVYSRVRNKRRGTFINC